MKLALHFINGPEVTSAGTDKKVVIDIPMYKMDYECWAGDFQYFIDNYYSGGDPCFHKDLCVFKPEACRLDGLKDKTLGLVQGQIVDYIEQTFANGNDVNINIEKCEDSVNFEDWYYKFTATWSEA